MHRHEHAPLPDAAAATPQMLDDRLADVAEQRQLVAPVGLAVDDDQPGTPVEIIEPQSRDLDPPATPAVRAAAGPRSRARRSPVAVTGGEEPFDLRSRRELRIVASRQRATRGTATAKPDRQDRDREVAQQ
jgi:hypothetical protein